MSDMQVRFLRKDEYPLWDELAAASPSGSVFDESHWFLKVADVYGWPLELVGVFDGERLEGGVVVHPSRRLGMATAAMPPLCPINSCLVCPRPSPSPAKAERHVLRVTESIARFLQSRYSFVVITNHSAMSDVRSFRWLGWRTNVLYTYHINLASADMDKLPKSRRRAIRKARESGFVLEQTTDAAATHDLLTLTRQRQGIRPSVTREQLEQLFTRCEGTFTAFLARLPDTGRPVAVDVAVIDRTHSAAYALFAGFDPECNAPNATSLLQWYQIEALRDQGLKTLDLVGADVKSNAPFKAEFGGRLVPYYQVSYVGPLRRIANRLWRDRLASTRGT